MTDADLIERMLDHYRENFRGHAHWRPPPRGALTAARGGFSGGPFGLAVRYALRGSGDDRECVWLETSRIAGTALMRMDPATGAVETLGEMQESHLVGPTDADTRRHLDRMHERNAAFWQTVADLGLDADLPTHTVVNAFLASAAADDLPGGPGGPATA